jgi:hypothetical protein
VSNCGASMAKYASKNETFVLEIVVTHRGEKQSHDDDYTSSNFFRERV